MLPSSPLVAYFCWQLLHPERLAVEAGDDLPYVLLG